MNLKEYFLWVFIKQYRKILKLTVRNTLMGSCAAWKKNMVRTDFEG